MQYSEKTILAESVYAGSIIHVEKLTVELPNGKTATRDIVRHKGASAVVPVTGEGEFLLVRQYRKPNEMISVEIPAGKLDAGEEPGTCAIRELEEETGYRAGSMEKLFSMQSTPGFSDEIIHVFLAADLSRGVPNPDEDEFITAFPVSFHDALAMIRDGRITDGKTIAGLYAALDRLGRMKLSGT
jgi:ADP-ribose pyrophosphatase